MRLNIDTTLNNSIYLALTDEGGEELVKKAVNMKRAQSERLLPEIEKLLIEGNIDIKKLKLIAVKNRKGTFTSLRIGVITANALGYALKTPVISIGKERPQTARFDKEKFLIVEPEYDSEPNITVTKKKNNKKLTYL